MAADLDFYLGRHLTGTQMRHLDWLREHTGWAFATPEEEMAYKLGVATKDRFSQSPENQAHLAMRKQEAKAAAAAIAELKKARKAAERKEAERHAADAASLAAREAGPAEEAEMAELTQPAPGDDDDLFADEEPERDLLGDAAGDQRAVTVPAGRSAGFSDGGRKAPAPY